MNSGHKISWIWRTLHSLAILYFLLLPETVLQSGAWQPDLPQGTVLQRARRYRELGVTKLAARSILTVWEAPSSYDQLLAQSSLVVMGRFRDQKCRLSGDRMRIETVSVFRADQVISGQIDWSAVPMQSRVMPEAETRPLGENEIFIIRNGGTLELFGIMMEDIETAFPPFKNNQTYILFLHIPPTFSKYAQHYGQPLLKAYETIAGPHSVIKVNKAKAGESRIESLVNNPQLRSELQVKFQSKLSLFLEHLKKE
jgi:hypothetical protein